MSHKTGEINHDLQQPDFGKTIGAIGLSALIVFASIWLGWLYYQGTISEEQDAKEGGPVPMSLQVLRHQEATELNRFQYEKNGQIKIPISLAKSVVVKQYNPNGN